MLGSAHPAHRAVVLRRPATSAVLVAVLARATLPPPSAPLALSPSAPHAPPPLPRPRLPLRSVIRELRGLVVGARVTERVAESPGAGARSAVMGESRGEGEERWRGEGVAVGGAEREVADKGGAPSAWQWVGRASKWSSYVYLAL
ncbi:unnamed protein product [Closterium sp. Naga37s-1]|nr:unnamed protein product [Closterium sp. Naga37s-1]